MDDVPSTRKSSPPLPQKMVLVTVTLDCASTYRPLPPWVAQSLPETVEWSMVTVEPTVVS